MMNVLVVAAHPDDEILGVGGTVVRHVENGDIVHSLILGEGQTSRFMERQDAGAQLLNSLKEDARMAADVLGVELVDFADLPDNRFDSVDLLDICKIVEGAIDVFKPHVIYTHHWNDLNIDHRRTSQAVMTATRPIGACPVRAVYAFETVSSTEWNFSGREAAFSPNYFVPLSAQQLDKKLRAVSEYRTEMKIFPHPRSTDMLKYLAKRWGAVIGAEHAEAFETIRVIA